MTPNGSTACTNRTISVSTCETCRTAPPRRFVCCARQPAVLAPAVHHLQPALVYSAQRQRGRAARHCPDPQRGGPAPRTALRRSHRRAPAYAHFRPSKPRISLTNITPIFNSTRPSAKGCEGIAGLVPSSRARPRRRAIKTYQGDPFASLCRQHCHHIATNNQSVLASAFCP
jgi:hypothetical protein